MADQDIQDIEELRSIADFILAMVRPPKIRLCLIPKLDESGVSSWHWCYRRPGKSTCFGTPYYLHILGPASSLTLWEAYETAVHYGLRHGWTR